MVEIVGQYTELRKAGANYSGRCPFHEERTPSFSVNPAEKLYYCFGCGAGGNLFGFVQAKENLDFAARRRVPGRQVRHRARVRGVERSRRRGASPPRAPARPARAGDGLLRARAARRGGGGAGPRVPRRSAVSATTSAAAFRLGFSLAGWDKLREAARAKKFSDQDLLDAGLVVPGKSGRPYDRFRGRIMFPLADDRGRTLGFGARTMGDEKPKYLNSPETPLYHKSEAVFGLHAAKAAAGREDRVYVVEGYTDVLALVQAGVPNVVASMGTALTEQQLSRLARVTRNLYLCFDADAAGLGAMSRALTLGRKMGLSLHVVRIPDGLDPADYVLSGAGGDGFRALAADAQTLLQFHVRVALATHDLDKPDGRARAFAQLKGVLSEAATPIERDEELRYVADRLQLSAESVRYLLAGSGRSARGRRRRRGGPPDAAERRCGGRRRRRPRARGALSRRLPGAAPEGPRRAGRRRRELLRHRRDARRVTRREGAIGARSGREYPAVRRARSGGGRRRRGACGGRRQSRPREIHGGRGRRALPAGAGSPREPYHREAQESRRRQTRRGSRTRNGSGCKRCAARCAKRSAGSRWTRSPIKARGRNS